MGGGRAGFRPDPTESAEAAVSELREAKNKPRGRLQPRGRATASGAALVNLPLFRLAGNAGGFPRQQRSVTTF